MIADTIKVGAVTGALDAGATGAKLTGAGGGGFLLVICPPEHQRAVRESLNGMQELPVKLDRLRLAHHTQRAA